jgi:hypothetical protein
LDGIEKTWQANGHERACGEVKQATIQLKPQSCRAKERSSASPNCTKYTPSMPDRDLVHMDTSLKKTHIFEFQKILKINQYIVNVVFHKRVKY